MNQLGGRYVGWNMVLDLKGGQGGVEVLQTSIAVDASKHEPTNSPPFTLWDIQ